MLLAAVFGLVSLLVASLMILGILKIPSLRAIYLTNKLPGPRCWPIVGYLITYYSVFSKDPGGLITLVGRQLEEYGGFFSSWTFGSPSCITCDPDVIKAVLNNAKYTKKGNPYYLMKPWLGEGLLTSEGEKWKRRRKILTPSFHNKFGELNVGIMNRHAQVLVTEILERSGTPENIWPILKRYGLKVILETSMGIAQDDEDEEYRRFIALTGSTTKAIMSRAVNPSLNRDFVYKRTQSGKKFYEGVKFLHNFTEKVIRKRRADFERAALSSTREEKDADGEDERRNRNIPFLDRLLALGMEDHEIREEVDTFTLGGHDTTSAAFLFILFELGHHPDIQEKVYEEQMRILGDAKRPVEAADLPKMVYLTAVIKEALRLYPPAPLFTRFLEKDVLLPSGRVLPANTNMTISIYHMQRNPKNFREPTAFVPERFLHTPSEWNATDRHPFAYIPFSAGPRNCIGQKFAMVEIKATISTIIRNIEIRNKTCPALRDILEADKFTEFMECSVCNVSLCNSGDQMRALQALRFTVLAIYLSINEGN
ncbi:Cytochrome P450-like protein [Nesidiocoris tenuis]|uniref:Cytochrome P450-like protein n=1 Tax=Nesidiocoris tenuis TaxID=355587 RepID=A0ABN7B7E6_9HEMI|nr:Cytochrome P450-like protein [Nesidiocoris tenuis]